LMNDVLGMKYTSEFYSSIQRRKDVFADLADDIEPVRSFFAGEQKQIFDKALMWMRIYNDSKNFLADQRNSGYIRIYYGNAPDPVTEEYNKDVIPLLKSKRYAEAVRKFDESPDLKKRALQDAEAANAYGIALYFTALDNKDADKEKEAIRMLETAAHNGSEAAAENLRGIETYGPARKEFEAWQELMKEEDAL